MGASISLTRAAGLLLVAGVACEPSPEPVNDASGVADAAEAAVPDAPDAFRAGFDGGADFVPESRRCDGQRLEGLYEGAWFDLGGCAVGRPNECTFSPAARLYHWNGGPGPSTACLPDLSASGSDLAATSARDVWFGGFLGVWRWDGRYWTDETPAPRGIYGRLAIADVGRPWLLWNASGAPELLHHDGDEWLSVAPSEIGDVSLRLQGVAAQPGGQVSVVGESAGLQRLLHFDGARWAWEDLAGSGRPLALATNGAGLWVARDAPGGVVIDHRTAAGFEAVTLELPTVGSGDAYQLLPIARADVWLVASREVHHWDGASWTTRALPGDDADALTAWSLVAAGGEVLLMEGHHGCGTVRGYTRVFLWDGAGWTEPRDGTPGALAALPGVNQVRAVGADLWLFSAPRHGC